jgi:oligoribonuclease
MYFFWVDCEMTGLNPNTDHILEIACIITDTNMHALSQYHCVIYHPEKILSIMNTWCQQTHNASGLLKKVKNSKKTYSQIDNELIELLSKHTIAKNTYIAGNSVYTDLGFIKKHLPLTFAWLHYRIFDISTFKLLALKKNIPLCIKKNTHTAISDIEESINEYKYYEQILLK